MLESKLWILSYDDSIMLLIRVHDDTKMIPQMNSLTFNMFYKATESRFRKLLGLGSQSNIKRKKAPKQPYIEYVSTVARG